MDYIIRTLDVIIIIIIIDFIYNALFILKNVKVLHSTDMSPSVPDEAEGLAKLLTFFSLQEFYNF